MSNHDHCYKCGTKIADENDSGSPFECVNCLNVDYKAMNFMHCIKCGIKMSKLTIKGGDK